MKERTNNKGSMKHKLLISYIIVFLIPLILSLVVYFISATYISKYSNEMKANEINATNTVVNNLFSTLNGVHYDIQNSNFMNVYSENISARSYDVVKFKNELARACAKNSSFFSDIHIIFNQDNFGVTAFSGDNIENYFESNSELYNESFSNWKTRISKFTDGVFSKYNGGVMYTKTILRDGNNSKATMIIFIPTQTLINLIDNAKIYADTNFTLLDNNNNILFQNNDIELPGKYINENLQDFKINELTSIKYEHKKFTVCHEKYYTFDYITAVGENSVEKSMKYLLFFILLFVAIIIAVGWYVVKQFVDKETKPIKKILEILKVYDDDLLENSDSADEFATIERSIMNRIDKTIKTKPFIADSIVSRIIKGSYNESYMPINFNYPNFQVVLLYFSTLGVFDEKSPPNTGKTNLLLNTAATNIIDEVLGETTKTYYSVNDSLLICLANSPEMIDIETIKTAHTALRTYFNVESHIAISDTCENLNDIPKAYKNAAHKLENMQLAGDFGVKYTDNINQSSTSTINMKFSEMFRNYIITGDYDKAEQTANDLILTCANNNNNINDIKFYLILMFNKTTNEIKTKYNKEIEIYLYESNFTNRLIEINMPAHIRDILNEYIAVVKAHLNFNEITDSVEKKVALFIRENYKNSNINLKIIADKFNITPAYLSQKFKTQYGVSALDYLSTIRIEAAKTMLKESKYSTKEIGEICGFTSTVTFNRQFKEIVGTTPGKYRQNF